MTEKMILVAVPSAGRKLFTYSCDAEQLRRMEAGRRIVVPFGRKRVIGYFIDEATKKPDATLRSIHEIIDDRPLIDKRLYRFLLWMADYYFSSIGDTLNAAIPPELRRIKHPWYIPSDKFNTTDETPNLPEKLLAKLRNGRQLGTKDSNLIRKIFPGLLEKLIADDLLKETWINEEISPQGVLQGYKLVSDNKAYHDLAERIKPCIGPDGTFHKADILSAGITNYKFNKLITDSIIEPVYGTPDLFGYFKPRPDAADIVPNEEQLQAIGKITEQLDKFTSWLLYGITGSGKTLVYCHVAAKVIEQGGTVLVLVPEIALAGTLLSYFKSFFGEDIALMHSALKPKERLMVWQNIKTGRYKIVIGARSAIFAPLEKLGLIIVDEEHDESYKQDDPAPRFQARDAAVMRAKMADIPIILGSATPSLESFHNARSGRYSLLQLTRRPEKTELPIIRLIDLKEEYPSYDSPFFTPTLISKIKDSFRKNHQVILYLNRRGFSPRIRCADCGHTPECPHCRISLTYHKVGHKLMCHFCGYINASYNACSECNSNNLKHVGVGTQKIEEKIEELFEEARLLRLDSDSAAGRDRAHLILSQFASKEYNLLLGTQMVTKGIDFPDVSLVGVLMADIGLDMPDFRAPEKLFAKLIQVSGRSGRGIIPGEVVIQTYSPNLDLIDDAARQDYDTFYDREIKSRESLAYPPFSHLVNFRFAAKKENIVQKYSLVFRQNLEARLDRSGIRVHVLGPAPCPLYRLRGMYRRHLFIKTKQVTKFTGLLHGWEHEEPNFGLPSSIKLVIDIDPYDMM